MRTIGEPVITAFTANNILQDELIEAANVAAHEILEDARYRWGLFYDAFSTIAAIDSGTVSVTNASTTVDSKDSDGNDADNFTNVAAGDWLRVGTDKVSYRVASVDTSGSPDTLELEDAYLGTTDGDASYKIIRDTYALTTTGLDEVIVFAYGDKSFGYSGNRLDEVGLRQMYDIAGGDLHRDTGGIPTKIAEIGVNSSDQPLYRLWPYPDDTYLIEYWYTLKFTSNTTFATEMFGANAPDIAYDAVADAVRARACLFDEDPQQTAVWEAKYREKRNMLAAREARTYRDDNQMGLRTYRIGSRTKWGHRVESQVLFDMAGYHHP